MSEAFVMKAVVSIVILALSWGLLIANQSECALNLANKKRDGSKKREADKDTI